MNDEEAIQNIQKKIEREKALIQAATAMRGQTNNEAVRSRLDSQMRDGRRNLQFFEEKLRDIQLRRVNSGMDSMSLGGGSPGPAGEGRDDGGPPAPPPKDSSGDHGSYGSMQYSQIGQHGDLMPPRHPYAPPGPGQGIPKTRPNYTKLGESKSRPPMLPYEQEMDMGTYLERSERFLTVLQIDLIKYDNPYLGPRIQLMLSQLQFKLNVEEQYLKGVEKMVQLYGMDGDRKSKADAAARKVESKQKIVILKQALKRYEELHIDMDSADTQDGTRPLFGNPPRCFRILC